MTSKMCAKRTFETLIKMCDFSKWVGHDRIMKNVALTSVTEGNIKAEFKVTKENLNYFGGLHGGYMASVMDTLNTLTMMSKTQTAMPGVTVDLHVSYLKGAKEGDEVLAESRTIRVGKKMAYMECELKHKSDGSMIAKSTQTQYVGQ